MKPNEALCASCGARILWLDVVSKATGKPTRLPVNATRVRMYDTLDTDGTGIDNGLGYVSHFVTCPQAAQHSKSKGSGGR